MPNTTHAALAANHAAQAAKDTTRGPIDRFMADFRNESLRPTDAQWDAYWAASAAVDATVFDAALVAGVGAKVFTAEHAQYVALASAGEARVVLTDDGGDADLAEWHEDGSYDGPSIFYQAYTPAGRLHHGYVHPVSRKLTQVG